MVPKPEPESLLDRAVWRVVEWMPSPFDPEREGLLEERRRVVRVGFEAGGKSFGQTAVLRRLREDGDR